jgi:hypothetical protein
MNQHASNKRRIITIMHTQKGLTDEVKEEKRIKRRFERQWRINKTSENRERFTQQRLKVNKMMESSEKDFYSNLVIENADNPKNLFRVLNSMLYRKSPTPLPPHTSSKTLADDFSVYFSYKIERIRKLFVEQQKELEGISFPEIPKYTSQLTEFAPLPEDEVHKMLLRAPSKSCELDPVPTWLLKSCADEVVPLITNIINLSFETAQMPQDYKMAILLPLLKRLGLLLSLGNYRMGVKPVFCIQTYRKIG